MYLAATNIISTEIIVWSICIGANLAFLYMFYQRNYIGVLIRRMLDAGSGEECARTLFALGLDRQFLMKLALKDGSPLRSTVLVKGGKIPTKTVEKNGKKRPVPDYESAEFYISERNLEKASVSYGRKMEWYWLPIFVILSAGISYGMTYLIPFMLSLFNF